MTKQGNIRRTRDKVSACAICKVSWNSVENRKALVPLWRNIKSRKSNECYRVKLNINER